MKESFVSQSDTDRKQTDYSQQSTMSKTRQSDLKTGKCYEFSSVYAHLI